MANINFSIHKYMLMNEELPTVTKQSIDVHLESVIYIHIDLANTVIMTMLRHVVTPKRYKIL